MIPGAPVNAKPPNQPRTDLPLFAPSLLFAVCLAGIVVRIIIVATGTAVRNITDGRDAQEFSLGLEQVGKLCSGQFFQARGLPLDLIRTHTPPPGVVVYITTNRRLSLYI